MPSAALPLPDFPNLTPDGVLARLDAVLTGNRQQLQTLEGLTSPDWDSLVVPLERMNNALGQAWGPLSHLFGVCSTPAWREAYNTALPKITEYSLELSQSEPLFRAYQALAARPDFPQLSTERRKVVEDALRDFRLSGIGLPEQDKARYKAISLRLSTLQSQFESNLMDAIQAYGLHVPDPNRLSGMSDGARASAEAKARDRDLDGAWITLDFPSFDAVISHAHDRELRRSLYTAYATRASDQGPQAGQFDNGPPMLEILRLRREEAELLGFPHYAALSLATKMADSAEAVEQFLTDLARRARARAETELEALRDYAHAQDGLDRLEPWDVAYYSERYRDATLGLSDEALKPYFPAPQVIQGMFDQVESLYGVRITAVEGIATWHEDVTVYSLSTLSGEPIGLFYLDPYARAHKRGGAWMDECLTRQRIDGQLQLPVAYLVGNFTPPAPGQPALLTHDEVLTLFHEFGHGLHHLLTQVEEASVSGIHGVEWDAVELPSQFMENWCYHAPTLQRFARHWQTGDALPHTLIDKLQASRSWQSGMATLRQIEFALFDLRLHRDAPPDDTDALLQQLEAVRAEVALMQPPAFNRMPWSFSHIFAGGYAAGYYSYKWAEVLSADAFAAFEESGFAVDTGHRFRDALLSRGGSAPALELFTAFRGRPPTLDALLRHDGLIASSASSA